MRNNIDYGLYDKLLSTFMSASWSLTYDELLTYIIAYIDALLHYNIIDFSFYTFCIANIIKDLKKKGFKFYEKKD